MVFEPDLERGKSFGEVDTGNGSIPGGGNSLGKGRKWESPGHVKGRAGKLMWLEVAVPGGSRA